MRRYNEGSKARFKIPSKRLNFRWQRILCAQLWGATTDGFVDAGFSYIVFSRCIDPYWFLPSINFQFPLFKTVRNSFNFGIRMALIIICVHRAFRWRVHHINGVERLATHLYRVCGCADAMRIWIHFISGYNLCSRQRCWS